MTLNGDFTRFNTNELNVKKTATKVKEKDRFTSSLNVLLNYWEIKPSQYEITLQELALRDIHHISMFIPWGHVETDIHHSLKKILRTAASQKFHVRLFVMPELGISYPNAGVPRDLLEKSSNLAVDKNWAVIFNHAAPNIFALPSFSSPEVLKRFGNFLIKISSTLAEVFNESGNTEFCEVVVSNTFFNYYRGAGQKLSDHGDFSAAHVMAFRDFLDKEYQNSSDNEQFKTQLYEGYNRHRYYAHVEKLLREKTDLVFNRKGILCPVRHIDLYNPECAPEAVYQSLLTELLNFKPSVQSYYKKIIEGGYRGEVIHLGNSGVFRRFSEQEKSFLILASIIYSGEVSIDADDLFKLSRNFQRKLRNLMDYLDSRSFQKQTRVTYLSASKFSMEEKSFNMLSQMAPGVVRVVAGLGAHTKTLSERLVMMDPKSVIRLYELIQLFAIAQSGKIVAIPMPMTLVANYTAEALQHLEKFRIGKNPLRTGFGVPCEIYDYHLGQIVFYDPQIFWTNAGERSDIGSFIKSLLGLAEVTASHMVSDSRIHLASYVSQEDATERVVFLINPTSDELQVKLHFTGTVLVSSLQGEQADEAKLIGKTFELNVPALGVLSMRVGEPGQTELNEGGVLWT